MKRSAVLQAFSEMTDIISFSQILIKCPTYKVHRFIIHQIYVQLAQEKQLNISMLKVRIRSIAFLSLEVVESDFEKIDANLNQVNNENLRHEREGVSFVLYGQPLYPQKCYMMEDPPLVLSYLGQPVWLNEGSLAVVGSREPSSDSLKWIEKELSLFCESEKPLIVSGGARGIDQKAHGVALRKGCPTLVVLPSGLGEIYPDSLRSWVNPILQAGGGLISEYDYSQKMHKYLFHHRNRLIAALGNASLLVEAKRKSGTLITANQAAQLGRTVLVVPGHPFDPHFAGCLDLLCEGATIVRDAQDLSTYFKAEIFHQQKMQPHIVRQGSSWH